MNWERLETSGLEEYKLYQWAKMDFNDLGSMVSMEKWFYFFPPRLSRELLIVAPLWKQEHS